MCGQGTIRRTLNLGVYAPPSPRALICPGNGGWPRVDLYFPVSTLYIVRDLVTRWSLRFFSYIPVRIDSQLTSYWTVIGSSNNTVIVHGRRDNSSTQRTMTREEVKQDKWVECGKLIQPASTLESQLWIEGILWYASCMSKCVHACVWLCLSIWASMWLNHGWRLSPLSYFIFTLAE